MIVVAAKKHGTGRCAHNRRVKLGEQHPFGRQIIDIWRSNVASEAAKIGVAEIICNDQQNIGPFIYRDMFIKAADEVGIDWRLLAAIGYQESHWDPDAVSPTGVRGIMMLTKATADYLDIEDRMDPESSILGGARFFARQLERLPDSVDYPDRTWMAVAAYNVGFYHIKDSRQIVAWQGGDPDTWVDISKTLPLLAL